MKKQLKIKLPLALRLIWPSRDEFSNFLLGFSRIYALIEYNLSIQHLHLNSRKAYLQDPVSIPPVTHY